MPAMDKLDLFQQFKDQYVAEKRPVFLEIPPVPYLAVVGQGEPGGEAFQQAVASLYGAAYGIKMARKKAGLGDYKVAPLQGQWWVDGTHSWRDIPRERWQWQLLIRVPAEIAQPDLDVAVAEAVRKKKDADLGRVRLVTLHEGPCVQMLHVGEYSSEAHTVAQMTDFAASQGLAFRGPHHEIYLSDPNRTAPEKLKTILRHPVTHVA